MNVLLAILFITIDSARLYNSLNIFIYCMLTSQAPNISSYLCHDLYLTILIVCPLFLSLSLSLFLFLYLSPPPPQLSGHYKLPFILLNHICIHKSL